MKNTIITEFVRFQAIDSSTNDQLLSAGGTLISDFMKKQDGYINAELVKDIQENAWCFIIRYESMEKVKALVEKLRSSIEFEEFKKCVVPGSINVSFNLQLNKWQ